MKADTIMFVWLVGCTMGTFVVIEPGARVQLTDGSVLLPCAIVLILGLTVGTVLNVGIGRVIPLAPNPALPSAIMNVAAVLVYVLAPLLAWVLPKYFSTAEFSAQGLIGVTLAIVGTAMVITR